MISEILQSYLVLGGVVIMSGTSERHLAEMTAREIREGTFDTAILPVGATEFHGDHLPYGSDTFMATALAERFALIVGTAIVLPAIPYGVSLHHLSFPWTVSVKPATLAQYILDIGESLIENGIRRLMVVSAHDGNPAPIEIASRTLSHEHGVDVALFTGWQGMARELLAEKGFDIDRDHAGSSEVSAMLYLRPELAHSDRSKDLPNEPVGLPLKMFSSFENISSAGYTGSPSGGSAAEGEAILNAIEEYVRPFLTKLVENDWRLGAWAADRAASEQP